LVDQHGDFFGSLLLGKQVQRIQRRQRFRPGRRECLSRRKLSGPAQLDRTGVSKLIHYNNVEKGGHYAAWEQPQLFQKRFAGFRPLRKSI
jgi:hypothetical protein